VGHGAHVRITVSDTGTGIEPGVLAHIFEPFYTTKGDGRGTGMGLASVYGTVCNHHGAIDVRSQPGRGTEMVLHLPRTSAQVPAADEALLDSGLTRIDARVLVVDDEATLRRVARRMLESLGCQVLTAASGREALSLFERHGDDIDVVMLDQIMPEMNGREVLERLRAIDPGLRAILASGFSVEEDVRGLRDVAFLPKPFRVHDLARKLAGLLEGARDGDQ
jgi:CheY-like chemotaxis protein